MSDNPFEHLLHLSKPLPQLFTVEDVAKMLKVNVYFVRDHAKGRYPPTLHGRKIGKGRNGHWRFTQEEVEQFMQELFSKYRPSRSDTRE